MLRRHQDQTRREIELKWILNKIMREKKSQEVFSLIFFVKSLLGNTKNDFFKVGPVETFFWRDELMHLFEAASVSCVNDSRAKILQLDQA